MIKKNKWYMRQARLFKLMADGQVKYFKNFTEYKVSLNQFKIRES